MNFNLNHTIDWRTKMQAVPNELACSAIAYNYCWDMLQISFIDLEKKSIKCWKKQV